MPEFQMPPHPIVEAVERAKKAEARVEYLEEALMQVHDHLVLSYADPWQRQSVLEMVDRALDGSPPNSEEKEKR